MMLCAMCLPVALNEAVTIANGHALCLMHFKMTRIDRTTDAGTVSLANLVEKYYGNPPTRGEN